MKVSEAIDQLKIGDEAWVKGKIVDVCRGENEKFPVGIELYDDNDWLHKNDEISLTEPTKQVKIPEYVAEWIDFCKEQEFSLYSAMSDKHLIDGTFILSNPYQSFRYWLLDEDYHEEIFARAWLDGFTVEPKRWVVKFRNEETDFYFIDWSDIYRNDDNPFVPNGHLDKSDDSVFIFTDKAKAEAVAVLVEGTVEEV